MSIGLILMTIGMIVCVGSFFFALWNMYSLVTSDEDVSFDSLFKNHIGAIAGMAAGMVLCAIGGAIMLYPLALAVIAAA